MSTVQTRAISHRYPGTSGLALREVSLTVADGEMVSVVGPSGSGKSTLLRVVAGLLQGSSGEVLVDGRDVADLPTERRDLTVMFQSPLLFEHLDVAGNVAFAPRLAGVSRREARRCARRYLRLVHLEGFDNREVPSLSGGQQQRVALARALAAERGALLLDEPFSSLDRELRTSMHELLGEVRAALAPTILMVTHDLDEAALAESTAVLIDGKIHQQAPMAELYQRPATLPVARLLGGFTEVHGTVHDGIHHSHWGRLPVAEGGPESGPAVALLRRESLRLEPADSSTSPGVPARAVSRRPVGTRVIVRLETGGGTDVEVELAAGQETARGDWFRAVLATPDTPQWMVPAPRPADDTGNDQVQSPALHDSGHEARPPWEETRS